MGAILSKGHQRRKPSWRSRVQTAPLVLAILQNCRMLAGGERLALVKPLAFLVRQSRRKLGGVGRGERSGR